MKILVCGGRTFKDLPLLDLTLDGYHARQKVTKIICGDAPGADLMAFFWAGANEVPADRYIAKWKREGRAAGPLRNQRMLDEGKPDLVIAFEGGQGTADMVRRARSAGVRVDIIGRVR